MLKVDGFQKLYGDLVAVRDLSFGVEPGHVVGLVGPNGAGKTTTLRAIAGILPPTQGTISIGGRDIARDPIGAKQAMAYVPDDPKLFEALTVWEHLRFVAAAYGVEGYEAEGERLLERFELIPKRGTVVQELSRGMRQKVAICCAYLHNPALVMLDEPLTGLDPRGIRTMKDSIVERARSGAAIIVSSHLLDLVEDLCTHLLVLDGGRSLFFGTMGEARVAGGSSLEDIFFRITGGAEQTGTHAAPPTGTP